MAILAQPPLFVTQDSMENALVNQSFFDLQQQQQKLQQRLQQQQQFQNPQHMYQNQNLLVSNSLKNNMVNTNTSLPSMSFYQSLAAQGEKQRQEMDQCIVLQNERLRLMLREQSKQQLRIVLKKIEPTILPLLRQKDEKIAQTTKRGMELEDFLKRLEMENQEWQKIAQENEAIVVSLNNKLEQLVNNNNGSCGGFKGGEAEDVESCCDVDEDQKTELNRGDQALMVCGGCKSRNSCVLFLPCRHLCSCQVCEAFLDSCPICNTVKNASIEVLL